MILNKSLINYLYKSSSNNILKCLNNCNNNGLKIKRLYSSSQNSINHNINSNSDEEYKNINIIKNSMGYLQSLDLVEFHKKSKKELEEINSYFIKYGKSSKVYGKFFYDNLDSIINLNLDANNFEISLEYFNSYKIKHKKQEQQDNQEQKRLPKNKQQFKYIDELNCFKETVHSIILKFIEKKKFYEAKEFFLGNINLLYDYIDSTYFFQFLQILYNNKHNVNDIFEKIEETSNIKPKRLYPIIIHFYLKTNQYDLAIRKYKSYNNLNYKSPQSSVFLYYSFIEYYNNHNLMDEALELFNKVKLELAQEEIDEKDNIKKKKPYYRFVIYQTLFEMAGRNNQPHTLDSLVKDMIKNNYLELPYIIFYNHLEYCKYTRFNNNNLIKFNNNNNNNNNNTDNNNNNNNNNRNYYSKTIESIFSSLLNNITDLKDHQKILIVDSIIYLFINHSSYDKALFWYSYLAVKLNIVPNTSITKKFTYYVYEKSMKQNDQLFKFWNYRTEDLKHYIPESTIFIKHQEPEKIYYMIKRFLSNSITKGEVDNYIKSVYVSMDYFESYVVKSEDPTKSSSINKNNHIINREDKILNALIRDGDANSIIDYLDSKYFKQGLIPPSEKLLLCLPKIKTEGSQAYRRLLEVAPDYIKVLTFNSQYYKTILKSDLNEFFELVSLENQNMVKNSTETLNYILLFLLRDNFMDDTMRYVQALYSKGIKILEAPSLCNKIFSHMKQGKMEYPQELFENYLLKEFKPSNIDVAPIYNCYLLKLIQEKNYQEALHVFESIKKKNQVTFDLGCEIFSGLYPSFKSNTIFSFFEKWDRLLDIKKQNGFFAYVYYEKLFKILSNNNQEGYIERFCQDDPTILQNININTLELLLSFIPYNDNRKYVDLFLKTRPFKYYQTKILDRLQDSFNNLSPTDKNYNKLKEFFDNYNPTIDPIKEKKSQNLSENSKLILNQLINNLNK